MPEKIFKITIIGFGRVGSAFAYALKDAGYYINYIIEKHLSNYRTLKKHFPDCIISKEIYDSSILDSEIILLCVQDNKISGVLQSLGKLKINISGKLFLHTSGILTSDVFLKIKGKNILKGSMHPIQTFSRISSRNECLLQDIYFGIEGDNVSKESIKKIIGKLGSKFIEIKKQDKAIYHSACVIASNYLITHIYFLDKLFSRVCDEVTLKVFMPIINRTLENALKYGIPEALTGPITRDDKDTIECHIENIRKNISGVLDYYNFMGEKTVEVARKQKSINLKQAKELRKLFKNSQNKKYDF